MSGRARLVQSDYAVGPEALARRLLGRLLVRIDADGARRSGRIVETEAYLGVVDRAAHSFAGRRTPRVEPMYGPPGLAYVYFTYGMHHCFNVVCGETDEPVAVLVRALEPLEGLDAMRESRSRRRGRGGALVPARSKTRALPDHELCRGPANVCRALEVDRELSGLDLTSDERLWIEAGALTRAEERSVETTPRIGVAYAGAWAKRPLRWVVAASASASGPRAKQSRREARRAT